MLLGPVFQSEMVTTARRTRYFVLRVFFAAGLLLCLWASYSGVVWGSPDGQLSIRTASTLAAVFFQSFAWLTLFTAILVTPAIAAGAISTERERRTIEYLFATDLSNAEIVLSKLFGKLLLVGKLVLVALPVLAIFRLLGGIPGNLLVVYFAGLASTVTLLTMGSLCISVWTARARDAVVRVYLVEAMLLLLPLLLRVPLMATAGATSWWYAALSNLAAACLSINPIYVLGQAVAGSGSLGIGLDASVIWQMVQIHLVLTVILAVVAVTAVRRVHLRSISSPGAVVKKRRFLHPPQFRPALRNHPMLWKELFARTAGTKLGLLGRLALGVILLGVLGGGLYWYCMILFGFSGYGMGWRGGGQDFMPANMMITGFLTTGTVILMGLRAAGLIAYEKERDCWLSLLSTPLTGAEIIGAKAAGNMYAFRWVLAPLLFIWFLQITLTPHYIVAIPCHLFTLGATGLFATAVGLAYSLQFKSSLKAIGATMGTLFFIGGGYLMCCCAPLTMGGGGASELFQMAMVGCIPFLLAVPAALVDLDDLFDGHDSWIVADYLIGSVGYAIAGGVLLSMLIGMFDERVGRTGRSDSYSPSSIPAPPITPPIPPAEVAQGSRAR